MHTRIVCHYKSGLARGPAPLAWQQDLLLEAKLQLRGLLLEVRLKGRHRRSQLEPIQHLGGEQARQQFAAELLACEQTP